jgi:hypothetical protein
MSLEAGPPDSRKSRRSASAEQAGFLGCLLALGAVALWIVGVSVVAQWAPDEIDRHLGWPYRVTYYLVVLLGLAAVRVWRYRRRGQTIREGLRADLARQRHRKQLQRHRRELRQQARQAAAALPWLTDKRRHPTDWPGVVITPAPEAPGYFRAGYDVVLDDTGDTKIRVVSQIRKLTRLPLATAAHLIDGAPVVVLRVPDAVMASAAKSVLEYAGATASVADPEVTDQDSAGLDR